MKSTIAELEAKENQIIADRDAALVPIGNVVHDSVPVSDNEVSMCSDKQQQLAAAVSLCTAVIVVSPVCPWFAVTGELVSYMVLN